MREIPTPDGRTLVVHEAGATDGPVILLHNGTPSSGLIYAPHAADAAARGVRLLSINRPGYAGSTRRAGRSVGDVADDVRAVLDALGIERCVTWGESGGGPHALACAALLPSRVAAAASLAGVAPFEADDLDWLDGMGQDNLDEFGAVLEGEAALRRYLDAAAASLAGATAEGVRDELESLLSEADRACLTGGYAAFFARQIEDGLARGVDGWLDDDLAFAKPWGFDLSAITVPVVVWQGDQDRFVPPAHGIWLAEHIAGAEPRLSPEDGHLTLYERRVPEVHAWLLERL